ncbi:hypothetical protein GGR57DRAFT_452770 [Xylariaceae sp. FL1272]|nr:hypothetical protein GGR57DRAFT_452770 [Xylariaceae sp. FL1272]
MTPVSASRRVPRAAPATPTTSPTAQTMLSTQRHHNTTPNPLMFGSISPVSTRATNNTPATEPEASSSTMAPQGPAQVHPPATMSPEIEAAIEAMSNLFTSEQWHLLPNLDDPGLVGKILSRRLGPPGTCSVAFSALPQHDPDGFSADFGRFGTVLIESHQKLAIRMKHCTMDLLNFVRQVWVSKYLTPFHPCSITFDLPDSTGFCNVVMQRVNPPPFNETAALNGNMARLSVVAEEDEYGGSSTMPTPMPATNPSPIFRAGSGPVNDDDFVDNNDVMTWPCRSPVPKDDEDEKSDGEDESARAIRGVSTSHGLKNLFS